MLGDTDTYIYIVNNTVETAQRRGEQKEKKKKKAGEYNI